MYRVAVEILPDLWRRLEGLDQSWDVVCVSMSEAGARTDWLVTILERRNPKALPIHSRGPHLGEVLSEAIVRAEAAQGGAMLGGAEQRPSTPAP